MFNPTAVRARRIRTLILACGVAVAAAAPAALARPGPTDHAFTYQGQLKKAGALYSGIADVRFTLWDDAAAGSQVGSTLTLANVSMTNGLMTVDLDFGTGVFTGDGRGLQIQVRTPAGAGSFTTLTPRQPILPTPYALYALNPGPAGPTGGTGPTGAQ